MMTAPTGMGLVCAAVIASTAINRAEPPTGSPADTYGILRKPIPAKMVVLTFDDSCLSHATVVAPLLKKYGFGGAPLQYQRAAPEF